MKTTIWTLVPMRGIEAGKSRLADVLDAASRARLNRWLLSHTLAVVERWHGGLKRCIVVSPCVQVLELARRAGAAVVHEARGANNLNCALALGATHAHDGGGLLVLPCDLPNLTAESLHEFAGATQRARHMRLAPDVAGTGTNALLVSAEWGGEFCFGERSCSRHQERAVARSWTISIHARPEFAFDLDTPRDLAAWLQSGAARRDARIAPRLHNIKSLEERE